jgi:outer membrane protein assembly factor BamB
MTVLRGVADALDYAHSQGVVHRDIRLSNVFYDPETSRVKVSDFGITGLVEGGHSLVRSTLNTPVPGYASPEYIQGQPPEATDDVYSLGTLAYELLTGAIPFDSLSPYTVLSKQLSADIKPPSHMDDTLPEAIDAPVLKALSRRKQDRFASCSEVAEAIGQAAEPYLTLAAASPDLPAGRPLEAGNDVQEEDILSLSDRVICPICYTGNSARALRCSSCWSVLDELPILSKEDEVSAVTRYADRRRKRRRIVKGSVGAVAVGLLAFWTFNVLDIRPPLPAPSSSISTDSLPGEWAVYQRDVLHTGAVPGPAISPSGAVWWEYEIGSSLLASPAIAGGLVFLPTGDGRLVALNEDTGKEVWTHQVNGPMNTTPVAVDDLVIIGQRDGRVTALIRDTGAVQWTFQGTGAIMSSPVVLDGVVYMGTAGQLIYALDARTGELRWEREVDNWVVASPVVHQDILMVASQGGELYLIDVSNGTMRYQVDVRAGVDTSATVVGDRAFITTRVGTVLAFDYREKDVSFRKLYRSLWFQLWIWNMAGPPPPTAGVIWARNLHDPLIADAAAADGRLFVSSLSGALYALDQETGSILWNSEGLSRIYTSPVVSGDTVIQAAPDGTFYGFDAATGEERWRFSLDVTITTSPVLAGDTFYVPTAEGTLYAVR